MFGFEHLMFWEPNGRTAAPAWTRILEGGSSSSREGDFSAIIASLCLQAAEPDAHSGHSNRLTRILPLGPPHRIVSQKYLTVPTSSAVLVRLSVAAKPPIPHPNETTALFWLGRQSQSRWLKRAASSAGFGTLRISIWPLIREGRSVNSNLFGIYPSSVSRGFHVSETTS